MMEGVIDEKHIVGEIGDILTGKIPARQNRDEITVFESLGLAVEDLAAADFVIQQAARCGW
jgi:ornithine cyclodeaminase